MTYFQSFREEFYAGSSAALTTAGVSRFDCAINGRGYMLDLANQNTAGYDFESVPMLHSMFLQDRGTTPIGEHSLNPIDYWRRSVDDWSAGSGQKYLDLDDSVGNQFRLSKGIDCWTKGQIGLLADTETIVAFDSSLAVVAGDHLYVWSVAGATKQLSYVTAPVVDAGTTVTAAGGDAPLDTVTGLTTDGYTVWVADETRVHYTTRGAATFTKYHTSDQSGVEYIKATKGRLFTTKDNTIYKHSGTAGSATAASYFVQPNSDWTWTAIEGGQDVIYFAGFSGATSMIYAATIKTDGTDLDFPIVFATLPLGETVRAMQQYLGVLVIGTDKGWRAAIVGSAGSLTLGSLVTMDNPPICFEPQDRFVWFGSTDYDSTSTGLGRIDLSLFNGDVPAYASDLMADGQGIVTSVVTFDDKRYFTATGIGLVGETGDVVASGSLSSGWVNYALADSKLAIKLTAQHRAGAGSYTAALAVDDRPAQSVGLTIVTTDTGSSETFAVPQLQGRSLEVSFTLNRSADSPTEGSVLDRQTLMVEPQPERRWLINVPVLLHSSVMDNNNKAVHYDALEERARFINLWQSRQPVLFQTSEETQTVIIDDWKFVPYNEIGAQRTWDGTMPLTLKVLN